jgi:hypothetical protein
MNLKNLPKRWECCLVVRRQAYLHTGARNNVQVRQARDPVLRLRKEVIYPSSSSMASISD